MTCVVRGYIVLFLISSMVFLSLNNSAHAIHGGLEYKSPKISSTVIWGASCADVDEDGICDDWESNMDLVVKNDTGNIAYTYTCGLVPKNNEPDVSRDYLTNPADYSGDWVGCPGPDKQDIFVEIDYMDGHYPDMRAISDVQHAFLAHNIRLHIQLDEMALNGAVTSSDRNYKTYFPGSDRSASVYGFDQVKTAHFGTSIERNLGNWMSGTQAGQGWIGKKQVFHYALFVNRWAGDLSASGIAEVWGNDIMISLGAFSGGVGSRDEQAGTFMHELGHNLKLHHGGPYADKINCKPHYLSVMNYAYQFKNFDTSRPLEYSRSDIEPPGTTSLSESNPMERPIALRSYPGGERNIVFGPTNPPPLPLPTTNAQINWDRDAEYEPSSGQDILGLNELSGCGLPYSSPQTYSSYNDTDNLVLKFRASDNSYFASGASVTEEQLQENLPQEITKTDVINQRISRIDTFDALMSRLLESDSDSNTITPTSFDDKEFDDSYHYIQLTKDNDVQMGSDSGVVESDSDNKLEAAVLEETRKIRKLVEDDDMHGAVKAVDEFRKKYDDEIKASLSDSEYEQYNLNIRDMRKAFVVALDYREQQCTTCQEPDQTTLQWWPYVLTIIILIAITTFVITKSRVKSRQIQKM